MNKLILLALSWLLICPPLAQSADGTPPLADLPIEVTAQQLEALRQDGVAIFSGEVVARQGDITLYCDRLEVYSQGGQQQVDRLEAFGRVRVVQLDRTATAAKVVYRQQPGTLVLTGDARLHQGQNQVSGDEITLYLQENRSVVKSGENGRVRAVLFPEPKRQQQ
jgi:lipopolysaccharide export system protein LptA